MKDVEGGIRHPCLQRDGLRRPRETRGILETSSAKCVVACDDEARELVGDDARREPERSGEVVACGGQVVDEDRCDGEQHQAVRYPEACARLLELDEIEDLEISRLSILAAKEVNEDACLARADDTTVDAEALEDLEGDRLVLLQEVDVVVDHADETEFVMRLRER